MLLIERLKVKSDLNVITDLNRWFAQNCSNYVSQMNKSAHSFAHLSLALTEGFTNAVRHAHHQLPSETAIEIELVIWDERVEIRIWDYGEPFDPNKLVEPLPGTLCVGGYGWFLLRRLADRVIYERCQDGRNCLLISSSL